MPDTFTQPRCDRSINREPYPIQVCQLKSISLEYLDVGEGPTVLFLHGALSDLSTWHRILPYLTKQFRCIIPTLPLGGHKYPAHPDSDLSVKGISAILAQFIEAQGLDKVHVTGNDTGGVYAKMLCAEYPERVNSLLLSNCDALHVFPPKAFSTLPKAVSIPGYLTAMSLLFRLPFFVASPLALGLLTNTLSGNELQKPLQNFMASKLIRKDFKKVAQSWQRDITAQLAAKLKHTDIPIQLVWGEEDTALFPVSLGQALASALGDVPFNRISGAKTYVHCDQPELMASQLRQFIDTV